MLARGQHNRILLENRVKFPEERNAFVLDYQFNMAAVTSRAKQVILGVYVKSLHSRKLVDNKIPDWRNLRVGGRGEGGILEQYLGFSEPLSVTKPDPV